MFSVPCRCVWRTKRNSDCCWHNNYRIIVIAYEYISTLRAVSNMKPSAIRTHKARVENHRRHCYCIRWNILDNYVLFVYRGYCISYMKSCEQAVELTVDLSFRLSLLVVFIFVVVVIFVSIIDVFLGVFCVLVKASFSWNKLDQWTRSNWVSSTPRTQIHMHAQNKAIRTPRSRTVPERAQCTWWSLLLLPLTGEKLGTCHRIWKLMG